MSQFIERSKHGPMTAAVNEHFKLGTPQPFGGGGKGSGVGYLQPGQAGHTVTAPRIPGSSNGLKR